MLLYVFLSRALARYYKGYRWGLGFGGAGFKDEGFSNEG